jgi:hypothetical protein
MKGLKKMKKIVTKKVGGIPKSISRLLKLYPNLRFYRNIAKRVCLDNNILDSKEFPKLSSQATLRDFLAKFRKPSLMETFVWSYIEAVTGDEDVHQKVY